MFVCLLVLALIGCSAAAIASTKDYKVEGLKKFGAEDEMYAGLMPLDWEKNSLGSFFFWLVRQRGGPAPAKERKLLVWLNGGPGCSSMVGMLWENGPFTVEYAENGEFMLQRNNHSWNEVADVLYVEQPLRTGFSLAARGAPQVRSEDEVGRHFRKFLLSFLSVFDEYKGVELFLSGESYAGFYIPWIAEHIVRNQIVHDERGEVKRDPSVGGINLVGAAIGNGQMDYLIQERSYTEYAYSHGLIPFAAKVQIEREYDQCITKQLNAGEKLSRGSFESCNAMSKVLEAAGEPNEYDTSTFRSYGRILNPDGAFFAFFRDAYVQESLHLRGESVPGVNFDPENGKDASAVKDWEVCSDGIDDAMLADHPITVVPTMQRLVDFSLRSRHRRSHDKESKTDTLTEGIKNDVRMLVYNGAFDLNCNVLGALHTLEANEWRQRPWSHADRGLWKFNDDVAGEYFTMDEVFSFLIVRNAGHLLPMDIPRTALEMIRKFIHGESFLDQRLPSESSYGQHTHSHASSVLMSEGQIHRDDSSVRTSVVFAFVLTIALLGVVTYKLYREDSNKNVHYSPVPATIDLAEKGKDNGDGVSCEEKQSLLHSTNSYQQLH